MMKNGFTEAEQKIIRKAKADIWSIIGSNHIFGKAGTYQNLSTSAPPEYLDQASQSQNVIITGGVFASLMNGDPYNDIDMFVLNENKEVFEFLTDCPEEWSDATKDYSDPSHIVQVRYNPMTKVNVILSRCTKRRDLLASFDFKHTTVSYVAGNSQTLFITRGAFDAITKKLLVPVSPGRAPNSSRVEKFKRRGYSLISWQL